MNAISFVVAFESNKQRLPRKFPLGVERYGCIPLVDACTKMAFVEFVAVEMFAGKTHELMILLLLKKVLLSWIDEVLYSKHDKGAGRNFFMK